jgi:hypothetical protein
MYNSKNQNKILYIIIIIVMSEFFSGSKPDLISMKSINELTANVFGGSSQEASNINVINQQATILRNPLNIKTFFINYIKPNLLPIIIILLFIGFLIFRYLSKDEKETIHRNKGVNEEVNNITNKEYFNPALPIPLQTDRMEYPTAGYRPPKYPNNVELEVSIDEILEKMKKKHGPSYDDYPEMDYCEFENPEDRESVYIGNTSWISQPDGDKNVVYNENNLVSSTGNFIQFGIEKNRDANKSSFDDLAKKIFN